MPLPIMAGLSLARAHWKMIGLGLLCLALAVQTVRLGAANNRADRIQVNLNEARAELKRISTAKNEQAKRTESNIDRAVNHSRQAERVAERIEAAPLPGNCVTPREVMEAPL
jgi:hypothetical protein